MALQLDGTDDAVTLGAFDVSSGIDELTLMAWVKPTGSGDDRILAKANGTSTGDHWWTLQMPSLAFRARLKTGSTTTDISGGTFTVDEWAHVALIYDGTNMIGYKNGVQVASSGKTGNVAQDGSVNVRIGDNPVGDRCFHGFIEDVRIYERALSVGELQTVIGLKGLDLIDDNLVHRWLLNDSADGVVASGSNSVIDSVGTVDGTPVGSPVYRGTILKSRKRVR